jgi:hypothetical protein
MNRKWRRSGSIQSKQNDKRSGKFAQEVTVTAPYDQCARLPFAFPTWGAIGGVRGDLLFAFIQRAALRASKPSVRDPEPGWWGSRRDLPVPLAVATRV